MTTIPGSKIKINVHVHIYVYPLKDKSEAAVIDVAKIEGAGLLSYPLPCCLRFTPSPFSQFYLPIASPLQIIPDLPLNIKI